MSSKTGFKEIECGTHFVGGKDSQSAVAAGHTFSNKTIIGGVFLLAAIVALVFAIIIAVGVFGKGEMGLVAGGLTVSSMVMFAISAAMLTHKKE